ncbi:hypothetical protein F441_01316 [Phytophthora nicotianae CJ01A1]|uniref:Uncharacterized protein n=5 Tax=Phytophthora nicotianae TaxID=4792 RepID=W2RK44_PHYN3|nr:hypothetical protein PPTG_20857 [Phytophthora nicotianae INRA-310]ETI56085.1 hypothetical protein F443_01337 [Phytophthora nicotianae P1569]ETK95849.1 hypothetical protein L915_01260 [Phytophthora nicotianae]ETO84770.1 hypothetical protein F444_01340 [Phytophthora nicotianae P1976]ETP25835.1 hypothetical protein F441_01316 [Phytophthora nicotianae CJ01A1]ETL49228.1 hypothetical protein L916_01245 [Phytophthora nicotianae]
MAVHCLLMQGDDSNEDTKNYKTNASQSEGSFIVFLFSVIVFDDKHD